MKKIVFLTILGLILAGCTHASLAIQAVNPEPAPIAVASPPQATPVPQDPPPAQASSQPAVTTALALPTPDSAAGNLPNFDHIVLIVLENEYLQNVIGSSEMPDFNALASKFVLLSNYFAAGHPSLPNYLVLVSGSTQNVTNNCTGCFFNQPNLADEIEASGRTWKSYHESMPSPCFIGNQMPYLQMSNPFLYFDSIRLDPARCDRSIVSLTQLDQDLATNQLPNFSLVIPNACDSGHNCPAATADTWVNSMVAKLQASPALGENSLIIITFDEGVKKNTNAKTRGEVATVLISPLARPGFNDPTAYSHYNLLKTILAAWNLPYLGETQQPATQTIQAPWISPADPTSPNN
jgi:acid phosphatase